MIPNKTLKLSLKSLRDYAKKNLADEVLIALDEKDECPVDIVRTICSPDKLGIQLLFIPEEYGGQGFSFVELAIVLEEMGRALLCAPYFSSVVLATGAIMNAGDDAQQAALLPGIASGEARGTVGVLREGEARLVPDADSADVIILIAPEGTTARPDAPDASATSTSTVGLPRLSRIWRA